MPGWGRLPQLPVLVDTAQRYRSEQAALLKAATDTAAGQSFTHGGREYRRPLPGASQDPSRLASRAPDLIEDLVAGAVVDIARSEHEAFWSWAIIEVLRHTGIRVEELLEITHLALVAYTLPATGEIVPMLQIVPSKNNDERLLLVSPELASVLASIISRLRADNDGALPLTARYDGHEKVTGPPLPHLFQHRTANGCGRPSTIPRSRSSCPTPWRGPASPTPRARRSATHPTTSGGCGPPPRSATACRSISQRNCWGTKTPTPPKPTWRSSTSTSYAPTGPSSTPGEHYAPKPNTANPPSRNGANSNNTSNYANSNWEPARAPTAVHAATSNGASDARACNSTPAPARA